MRTLTSTDTQVDLTVNKLNEEAFNDLSAQNRLDQNQLYVVTEDPYMVLGQGSGATIRDMFTVKTSPDVPNNVTFVALEDNSTVGMESLGGPSVSLEYSTDNGQTWNAFTVGSTTITLAHVNDMVQFRATSTNSAFALSYNSAYNHFVGTGSLEVAGDLRTLYDKDNWQSLDWANYYAMQGLFRNLTALKDAKYLNLGFTSFNDNAAGHFMDGCSNLLRGPYIKATGYRGSYSIEYFFQYCSSLQEITLEMATSTAEWSTGVFQLWVSGVPTGGTIYTNRNSPGTGVSYFPSGWTIKSLSQR